MPIYWHRRGQWTALSAGDLQGMSEDLHATAVVRAGQDISFGEVLIQRHTMSKGSQHHFEIGACHLAGTC